jgi:hypothetical protein
MMMNKLPPNTTIDAILSHLETSTKWGIRNRALFAIRQALRIRDISGLLVSDLLGLDGKIRSCYIAQDGAVFYISEHLKDEITRYLISRFELSGTSLKPLLNQALNQTLFSTQKRESFSSNTLAQHFCYLDKDIWERFKPEQERKRMSIPRAPYEFALNQWNLLCSVTRRRHRHGNSSILDRVCRS